MLPVAPCHTTFAFYDLIMIHAAPLPPVANIAPSPITVMYNDILSPEMKTRYERSGTTNESFLNGQIPLKLRMNSHCIPKEMCTHTHPGTKREMEAWMTFGKSPGGFTYSCFETLRPTWKSLPARMDMYPAEP